MTEKERGRLQPGDSIVFAQGSADEFVVEIEQIQIVDHVVMVLTDVGDFNQTVLLAPTVRPRYDESLERMG